MSSVFSFLMFSSFAGPPPPPPPKKPLVINFSKPTKSTMVNTDRVSNMTDDDIKRVENKANALTSFRLNHLIFLPCSCAISRPTVLWKTATPSVTPIRNLWARVYTTGALPTRSRPLDPPMTWPETHLLLKLSLPKSHLYKLGLRLLGGLLVALLNLSPALAAAFLVDDSKSTVLDANLPLQWRSLSPSSGDHTVRGVTRVQVRLDTSPWVGKFGRIYMALPQQPNGIVSAKWQTQGTLLAGQASSVQRGLVWSGVVPRPLLDDVLTVVIETDGRLLSTAQVLRFYFEIDLP